jgi:uncharacterized protein (TIGR02145 family)
MRAKFFIFSTCLLAIFSSGFVNQNPQTGTVKDIDGNIYKTIRIGDQWWMAENLRVTRDPEGNPITSYFYEDNSHKFGKYGRLYTWHAAMNGSEKENAQGIAPDGWHIPSNADWEELVRYLGGEEKVAEQISVGGPTGFDAYLSGGADFRGNYVYFNKYAMFWTSTPTSEERAYHVGISDEKKWDPFAAMKGARIHIRCVKNKN